MAEHIFAISQFIAVCFLQADGKYLVCRPLADGKELVDWKFSDSCSDSLYSSGIIYSNGVTTSTMASLREVVIAKGKGGGNGVTREENHP